MSDEIRTTAASKFQIGDRVCYEGVRCGIMAATHYGRVVGREDHAGREAYFIERDDERGEEPRLILAGRLRRAN